MESHTINVSFADSTMGLKHKGSFSYQQDKVYFAEVGEGLQARIQKVDGNISKVFFFNTESNQCVPIPEGFRMVDSDGGDVARFGDEFAIVWFENVYEMYRGDEKILRITRQQHAFVQVLNK